MTIANLAITNTFTEQMTGLNQVIVEMNRQIEGQWVTLGNVTILNSLTASPLGMNVHAGGTRSNFIEVGPGSNTYPSVTQKGTANSNTGIYFPRTNTLSIVTASNDVIFVAETGNVGLGTTTPAQKLDVRGRSNLTGQVTVTGNVGINKANPTVELDVVGNGYFTGNLSFLSDASVKTDITPITNARDIVRALNGVRYRNLNSEAMKIGMIAQQVREVLPEIVCYHSDNLLGLNYPVVVAVLIEAYKELSAEVETLKKRLH